MVRFDKNKLAMLLTYEGEISILSRFIDYYKDFAKKYNFDLIILSENNIEKITSLVTAFNYKGYHNIYFQKGESISRYDGYIPYEFKDNSCPDYKLYVGQLQLSQKYEYIWTIGIGRYLQCDKFFNSVYNSVCDNVELIILGIWNNKFNNPFDDNDILVSERNKQKFYENFAWFTTMYGATIISSRVINCINCESNLKKYLNSGFLYNMSIYDYISSHNINVRIVDVKNDAIDKNMYRLESDWLKNSDGCKIFAKNWCIVNDKLPDIYEYNKKRAILNQSKYSGLFEKGIRLRASGSIDIKKYFKYYKYIRRVTNVGMFHMIVISLIPRTLCKMAIFLYNKKNV